MKQIFEVQNVKCGGCANTLIKSLKDEYKDVEVNLEVMPRQIILDIDDNKFDILKVKLRELGYPLIDDELSTFQTVTTKAKSFVSCAVGKIG